MEYPHTPPPSAQSYRRILFDSPLSDYSTVASPSPEFMPSAAQKEIVDRLSSIALSILRKDISKQRGLWMSERLDALEDVVAAPESQSRSELEDSALFIEDDADDTHLGTATAEGLGVSNGVADNTDHVDQHDLSDSGTQEATTDEQDGRTTWEEGGTTLGDAEADHHIDDVFFTPAKKSPIRSSRSRRMRAASVTIPEQLMEDISTAIGELRMRQEETKYLNSLMLEELDVANGQNLSLRNANDKLVLDLHLDYSELLFLKIQLQTIEAHALPLEDENSEFSFVRAIERLELDWRDVEKRFANRLETHGQKGFAEQLRASLPEELQEVLREIENSAPTATPAKRSTEELQDVIENSAPAAKSVKRSAEELKDVLREIEKSAPVAKPKKRSEKLLQPPGHILERLSQPSSRASSRVRAKSRDTSVSKSKQELVKKPDFNEASESVKESKPINMSDAVEDPEPTEVSESVEVPERTEASEPVDSPEAHEAIESDEVPKPAEAPHAEEVPETTEVSETRKEKKSSSGSHFWDALANAAGIVDYYHLLADDDNDDSSS